MSSSRRERCDMTESLTAFAASGAVVGNGGFAGVSWSCRTSPFHVAALPRVRRVSGARVCSTALVAAMSAGAPPTAATVEGALMRVDTLGGPAPEARTRGAARAVVVVPGYGSAATEYAGLARALRERLGPRAVVRVAPVGRADWARTLGGRPVTPVLHVIDRAVEDARAMAGVEKVTLVGHSAGGWISRIYLSRSAEYHGRVWAGADRVAALLCLGTPHRSAEPVTMKNMTFVNSLCPGCAEAPDVQYFCVAGTGFELPEPKEGDRFWRWRFWESPQWLARLSYELTDTDGNARIGDGIVPTSVSYLDGATNMEMEGIWHSPTSPGPWYGDPRAVAWWADLIP